MKREKELAERRKNEPKLDQSQDHLVRKIFSRFRKGGSTSSGNLLSGVAMPSSGSALGVTTNSNGPCGSQAGTPSHSVRDVERGELLQHQLSVEFDLSAGGGQQVRSGSSSPRKEKVALIKAVKEDETASASSRTSSAKSKWGRMIRGGSSGSSDVVQDAGGEQQQQQPSAGLQTLLPVLATTNAAAASTATTAATTTTTTAAGRVQSAGSGNKIHPKLSRVPERQETSVDEALPLDRSRLTASQAFSTTVSADYSPPVAAGHCHQQMSRSDSSSIIDSFTELKQEVRSEVQRINHKMSRLEDILGEILVRLTPASVAAATAAAQPAKPPPPPLPSARSPGGRIRHAQVAPAPADNPTASSASSQQPFLLVPGNTADPTATTPVPVDVDSGAAPAARPTGRSSGKPQSGGTRSRSRPRSAGTSDKLTTQFQEYV